MSGAEEVVVIAEAANENNQDENSAEAGGDGVALSSKSSDISIEEIGAEEKDVAEAPDAPVLIPEPDQDEAKELIVPPAPPPTAQSSSAALGVPSLNQILDETDDLELEDEDEDFEDETLYERLVGLTEMFPEGMTSGAVGLAKGSVSGAKWLYGTTRTLTWIVISTASILFLPVMIETQLLEIEEAQKQQQRQILLGPGSAMSAGQNAPLPKAPV